MEQSSLVGLAFVKQAYLCMLRLPDGELRVESQGTLCSLRDIIARAEGRTSQEVQEECEEIALRERFIGL